MVDLAELVSDDPFEAAAERTRRGVQAPGRYNEPQPEGVPPTLGGTLAAAADPFGIPSAIAGDVISPEFRDKWRGQYEGETASQLIGGSLSGGLVAKGVGAVARPVVDAVRAHKVLGPTAVGAAALPLGADAAGVQTDRPAESFEVPLPEPDPKLVEEHNAIQDKIGPITASFDAKMQQLEASFQQRATAKDAKGQGLYPTTRARELDAAQHEKARESLRQQWKEEVEPLREQAKEIATRIRWQQENQKKERQAAAKAEADAAAAKAAKERPLVEQYPALLALPYLGGAYAAGVTYNARRQAINNYNAWVKQAEDQLKNVDKLTAAAEKGGKKVVRPAPETIDREKQVLAGFSERAPGMEKKATSSGFLPAAGSGGLIAAELAMAPYLIDWATQEPESAAGKEARHRLATLDGWMKTATSALAGVTGAGIGATAPAPKVAQFPTERAKVVSQPGGVVPGTKPAAQPRQPAAPVGVPPAQFSPAAAKARQKTPEESLQTVEQKLASGQNLARPVLERGRGGRPIKTEPLNIGSEGKILEEGFERSKGRMSLEGMIGETKSIPQIVRPPEFPKRLQSANDPDITGRGRVPSYEGALRDQMIEGYAKNATIKDFGGWKAVAEKNGDLVSGKPNALASARAASKGGKTTIVLFTDGKRVVFHDGVKVVRDLPPHRHPPQRD